HQQCLLLCELQHYTLLLDIDYKPQSERADFLSYKELLTFQYFAWLMSKNMVVCYKDSRRR
ncbi:MAG: hypothetical protein ACI9AT_000875, partial [Ulvibacter sp.]